MPDISLFVYNNIFFNGTAVIKGIVFFIQIRIINTVVFAGYKV